MSNALRGKVTSATSLDKCTRVDRFVERGTSGVSYLRKMLDTVLFPELWALRTEL